MDNRPMDPKKPYKPFTSREEYFQLLEEEAEMKRLPPVYEIIAKWTIISFMILGVYFLIQEFKGDKINDRQKNESTPITSHPTSP